MATPPSELPKLIAALEDADVALGSRIQPDGSDMRATQPRYRRLPRRPVPPARLDLGRRRRQGHPVRLQGLHARGRAGPVRAPAGHLDRVRRRAHPPRPPPRLPDRGRADPLGGRPRLAHAAGRARSRSRSRGTCSEFRCSTAESAAGPDREEPRPGRAGSSVAAAAIGAISSPGSQPRSGSTRPHHCPDQRGTPPGSAAGRGSAGWKNGKNRIVPVE